MVGYNIGSYWDLCFKQLSSFQNLRWKDDIFDHRPRWPKVPLRHCSLALSQHSHSTTQYVRLPTDTSSISLQSTSIDRNRCAQEFCQTFCLHLILATLLFWRYSTCQLHLTTSTIARYFNDYKLITVLAVLSWPGLCRIWVIEPNMCVFLLPGRLRLQICMAFHKDRSCSCYILLTCCSLSDDIIFIRTPMLTTPYGSCHLSETGMLQQQLSTCVDEVAHWMMSVSTQFSCTTCVLRQEIRVRDAIAPYSTGYVFRSEFVCASWLTAAFMAAHHHTSLRHCVWRQTWNHVVACGPGLHRA